MSVRSKLCTNGKLNLFTYFQPEERQNWNIVMCVKRKKIDPCKTTPLKSTVGK